MTIKNIVTFADGSDAGLTRVRLALDLARASGAHVEARYLYPAPKLPVGVEIGAMQGMYDQMLTEERDRAQTVVEAITAVEPPGGDFSTSAHCAQEGQLKLTAGLAMHGADLAITALPEDNAEQIDILDGALFASGAPCLALPRWISPHTFGERVMIAWKATPQAGRALSAALPFLARAHEVRLLLVNPRGAAAGEDVDGLNALSARLLRHGVNVGAPVVFTAENKRTAQTITEEAAVFGADLLVMGAYSRSRLAEKLIGGVTHHMIRHARIPLLLAH